MLRLAAVDWRAVTGPHNYFGLDLNPSADLLVAGGMGCGITPLVLMAKRCGSGAVLAVNGEIDLRDVFMTDMY